MWQVIQGLKILKITNIFIYYLQFSEKLLPYKSQTNFYSYIILLESVFQKCPSFYLYTRYFI